ncbi:hypothetical protein BSL78_03733 [Apostichopus japonicus]|uniref:Band 7 domain-containing protein n=1 Tax=Stichopus japonicus TaxID=307972 RepID=A0A2G8LGK8_STIJA|nr:hypothetical protein BSL78_03733 [Apostichopus japonicus]
MADKKQVIIFWLTLAGIAALLLVIMLPRSFKGVEFDEFGFKRRKASGRVDTTEVFMGGRYYIGITFDFKKFPADAHFVEFYDLAVFTSDVLRLEDLALLHDTYDLQYKDILEKNALDAIKSSVTQFSTRDFGTIRDEIEETLFRAVRSRLGGLCCPLWCDRPGGMCNLTACISQEECGVDDLGLFASVRFFQLLFVDIPDDVISRNLLTLTQLEDGEREEYIQDAQLVQIQTEKMVQDTQNKASELSQNATAQSNLIRARAVAEAQAIVEGAHSQGLALMFSTLNITTQEQKASLNYLRTLRDHQDLYMSINFNSLVNTAGFN